MGDSRKKRGRGKYKNLQYLYKNPLKERKVFLDEIKSIFDVF